ncbi:secreted ookinete protein, putative [Plasmodium vivax]|uniref:Secreted ookinete protein, putative n=1 Tax=Plasmodium vivax TaxID=5855 RepID=A0A1G4H7L8_PLAVI|nr:secreted ookinete protein, putative [Plasmodium vivax]
MNKLLSLSLSLALCLCAVAAVRPPTGRYESVSKSLNEQLGRRGGSSTNGKAFNLQDNIKYERKNNYELFVDANGELQQQRFGVKEPRQLLKKSLDQLRYLINDLEILTGVYTFNARDKEKVLKETLKPESLCFTMFGLLANHINKLLQPVEDSPIYGLIIKGERNTSTNEVSKELSIYVILSNLSVYVGEFKFPTLKTAPYEIPFLVGYYDSKGSGFKNKAFSYVCPLPTFLIDVIRTTKMGMKFNFNGGDLDVKELFPASLSHWVETPSMLPAQTGDKHDRERKAIIEVLKKEAKDVTYRKVHSTGVIEGVGIVQPQERILASISFANMRETVKRFLASSGRTSMDGSSTALYFVAISQKLFATMKDTAQRRVTRVEVSNVVQNKAGFLQGYSLKLTLEDSTFVATEALVQGKNVLVPRELRGGSGGGVGTAGGAASLEVPVAYGLRLGGGSGLAYSFAGLAFDLSRALPYSVSSLASFARAA